MNNIDLSLGRTTYRDEKPPTHDIRFTVSFENDVVALAFYCKLINFIKEEHNQISKE